MKNPRTDTLQHHIRHRLETAPDDRALAYTTSDGDVRWRSLGQFYQRAAHCGAVLTDKGLRPGDVCVLVLTSDEFCADVLFGCLIAGGVPLLVAPPVVKGLHSNLTDVIRHVIRKTRARVAVLSEDLEVMRDDLVKSSPQAQLIFDRSSFDADTSIRMSMAEPRSTDIGALQLTSGTTGFPRICKWEQRRILAALDGMEAAMGLSKSDLCVNWTPLYHDMGLVNNFFLCMVKGIPLVMIETLDFVRRPALWLRTLAKSRATVTWSPNFGFAIAAARIRDAEMEGVRLDRVRGFWSAAERIHYDTMLAFQERFKPFGLRQHALKTNFGCAENVGGATFSDAKGAFVVEHVDRKLLYGKGIAKACKAEGQAVAPIVGVGRPYPGMKIKILSRTGRPLADGHVGEIGLKTPSCMIGYMLDARSTRRALQYGYLRTGDHGYMRGDELFWTGRVKERINIHGNKFDPSEFEAVLNKTDGIREGCFAAFGVDDRKLGTQRLVVVAEVRKTHEDVTDKVIGSVVHNIAQKVGITVSEVLLMSQGTMSKTSSGKRRHRFYRQMYIDETLAPRARWSRAR